MINNSTFTHINSDTHLAAFFNHVMNCLNGMRMLCAPDSFRKDETIASFQDEKFCEFCRYEEWMHAVVDRLEQWRETIAEYFTEFHGNWKYYAAFHRIEAIKEYGGDDSDYDDDGEIRRDGLDDKAYVPYTVLSDLYDDEWKDIVQDTMPDDMKNLCTDLIANSHVSLLDTLKETFGKDVQQYRQDENGEMILVTQEEHDLRMVSQQVEADDDAKLVMGFSAGIQGIICMIKKCRYDDDNTELLQMVDSAACAMLDADLDTISTILQKFGDKYMRKHEVHRSGNKRRKG